MFVCFFKSQLYLDFISPGEGGGGDSASMVLFFARNAMPEQRNYPHLYFLFMAIISYSRNSPLIPPALSSQGGAQCEVASYQLTENSK